jgi:hypothetical protein
MKTPAAEAPGDDQRKREGDTRQKRDVGGLHIGVERTDGGPMIVASNDLQDRARVAERSSSATNYLDELWSRAERQIDGVKA